MTTVLVLVGSDREGGFNQTLATVAIRLLSESADVRTFDSLSRLPHLREDQDEPGLDPVIDEFRQAVRDSDAVLFVSPEYNGGPPSLIKNALDHASRPRGDAPIAGKPAAVIGATPSPGATKGAREVMLRGFGVAGADPVSETYGIGSAHQHSPADGYDAEVAAGVAGVIEALLARAGQQS